MRRFWDLYLDGADGLDPDASPLRATDLAGSPPAYVLTAEPRRAARRGRGLRGRARARRRAGDARRFEGAIHGFWRWQTTAIARDAVREAARRGPRRARLTRHGVLAPVRRHGRGLAATSS